MTTTLVSERCGPGPKETWMGNVLARQQRAHAAVTQLGPVGGSLSISPTSQMQLKRNHINSAIGRGLCFSQKGFRIFGNTSEVPSEPHEPLQSQAGATHVLCSDFGF